MKKAGLVSILLTLVCLCGYAVVAKPGPRVLEQPNGDTLTVWAYGNQHFHWMEDSKGNWIEQGEDGFYHMVPALDESQIEARLLESETYQGVQRAAARKVAVPLNIAPRGLVILANFSDVSFKTATEELTNMVNGTNYTRDYSYTYRSQKYTIHSEGSARQYFIDQSMGQYQPQFDVVGPYTVSNGYSYYGSNNDAYAYKLIIEACKLADADGVDFSQYDCNNDGLIDFVYVIYAGYGEADGGGSNTIWPHTYWIKDGYGQNVKLDGKYLNTYACGNELQYTSKLHFGPGIFIHEFSHVLGLPDLYCTTQATHKTMCEWDVMDAGPYNNDGNTPPAFSAYERFFCGWLTPTILNRPITVAMEDLQTSNKAFIVTESGESNRVGNNPSPAKFYMIENRQPTGWDAYLPGDGMIVTYVQYNYSTWVGNTVNNTAGKLGVDIIEADGRTSGSSGRAKDAFPEGGTEFSPYTQYPITDIHQSNGNIIFDFMGGSDWISSIATEHATDIDKKGRVYTTVEAVYDASGKLISTDTKLTELGPGFYIIKVGDDGEGKEHHSRGVQIYIKP